MYQLSVQEEGKRKPILQLTVPRVVEEEADASADYTTCTGGGSRYNQLTVPRVEEEEAIKSADCTTCRG